MLQPHIGGRAIVGFATTPVGIGEGFMGELARVILEYDDTGLSAPGSVIAKFASPSANTREMARQRNLYAREIGFYQDIGQAAGVPLPDCYYSRYLEDTNQFVILLEDLAPGEASDQVSGTSKETSREVIEQFARLHAEWWNNEMLDALPWARWIVNEVPVAEGLEMLQASIANAEVSGRFDAYPEIKRLMHLLRPLFRMEPGPPFPFSLTHGDLRSDNIIQPTRDGGRFAVIDWQLAGKGDPVNDIARWLVQSITIDDRRETEQALLQLYHRRLIEYGVKHYSYRSFINNYKINLIVVLLMFSMSMDDVDQSSARAKALFHEFYSRLDAALVDWEIEKLLKVLPYMVPVLKLTNWLKLKFGQKT